MTCIAWDGKTLAADKQSTNNNLARTVTKITRVGKSLVGGAGDASQTEEMVAWLRRGAKVGDFPASQRDKEDWASMLVIRPGGFIDLYERTPYPTRYEDKIFAIGSGRDFALAAMYLGKCASDAVEIASIFDAGSGNGVDVLVLR